MTTPPWCREKVMVYYLQNWLQRMFEGRKNMFLKPVKRVRKGEQARDEMVNDVIGQILRDGEVRRRRSEYFDQDLNMDDVS